MRLREDCKSGDWRGRVRRNAINHLICPSVWIPGAGRFSTVLQKTHTGQELAPAFTISVNRLLWRRRALPSATLDKMRTKLLER